MKSTKKYFRAFTLVELIIVITILAVLATIAFVSFSGYTKNSRDANRLSTLTNIEKGLIAYQVTTGKYPVPDNAITISDSGITIGQQGIIGTNVSNLLKISKIPTDPQDGTNYVYSKNESGNKYQLMTFLESQQQTAFFKPTYADFSTRFPTTQGDNLGIILEGDNTPAQTDISLQDTSNTVRKVYFKNEVKTGTGVIFTALKTTYTKMWKDVDKNCDIDDIVIGDQIWAGCNSTLGNGVERGKKDDGTDGVLHSLYGCYDYDVNNNLLNCPISAIGNSMISSAKENAWTATDTSPNAGGRVNNIWGKLYTWNNSSSACPIGWHVPSDDEFTILEQTLGCPENQLNRSESYGCNGLGWSGYINKNTTNNIIQALKIPLAGYRLSDGTTFYRRGQNSFLWSSTSTAQLTAYIRYFHWNNVGVHRSINTKPHSFSVRCIKD